MTDPDALKRAMERVREMRCKYVTTEGPAYETAESCCGGKLVPINAYGAFSLNGYPDCPCCKGTCIDPAGALVVAELERLRERTRQVIEQLRDEIPAPRFRGDSIHRAFDKALQELGL